MIFSQLNTIFWGSFSPREIFIYFQASGSISTTSVGIQSINSSQLFSDDSSFINYSLSESFNGRPTADDVAFELATDQISAELIYLNKSIQEQTLVDSNTTRLSSPSTSNIDTYLSYLFPYYYERVLGNVSVYSSSLNNPSASIFSRTSLTESNVTFEGDSSTNSVKDFIGTHIITNEGAIIKNSAAGATGTKFYQEALDEMSKLNLITSLLEFKNEVYYNNILWNGEHILSTGSMYFDSSTESISIEPSSIFYKFVDKNVFVLTLTSSNNHQIPTERCQVSIKSSTVESIYMDRQKLDLNGSISSSDSTQGINGKLDSDGRMSESTTLRVYTFSGTQKSELSDLENSTGYANKIVTNFGLADSVAGSSIKNSSMIENIIFDCESDYKLPISSISSIFPVLLDHIPQKNISPSIEKVQIHNAETVRKLSDSSRSNIGIINSGMQIAIPITIDLTTIKIDDMSILIDIE